MKYRIEFTGREVNAIGIRYPIVCEVEADTEEAARIKLYEKYEHIAVTRISPLEV